MLRLQEHLQQRKQNRFKEVLLDKKNKTLSPHTELLLYMAARTQLIEEKLNKALFKYDFIICDRFFDSTVAYQGIARGLGEEQILNMSLWATGGLVPDITFLLSVKVSMGDERINAIDRKRDRMEVEKSLFKKKIYEGYLKIARKNKDRFIVLNGGDNIQVVFDKVKDEVLKALKEKKLL
jgi:dTMP kinase